MGEWGGGVTTTKCRLKPYYLEEISNVTYLILTVVESLHHTIPARCLLYCVLNKNTIKIYFGGVFQVFWCVSSHQMLAIIRVSCLPIILSLNSRYCVYPPIGWVHCASTSSLQYWVVVTVLAYILSAWKLSS